MESQPQIDESTNDPLNHIQFSDIFNLTDLQHLQDLFADVNGVASIITQVDGTPITKPSNFSRLCRDIIRKTEKGCANCLISDAALGLKSSSGPVLHQCQSSGLWEAGARITIGGKHIANWIIEQVRNDELDIQRMIAYADEIGVNQEIFLEALNEIPVMSLEQFGKLSQMLFLVANEHSERAYNNWLLKAQNVEQEKARALLEESENRFQALFKNAPFGYQSLDFDGHFIEVNQKWLDTLGFTREEVIGKWFGDFLSPAYQNGFRERFPIFKAEGRIHSEFEMIHKNGTPLFIAFDGTIGYDLNGEFKRTHCILQDITESKREEEAIHKSEEKYRTFFAMVTDALFLVNQETFDIVEVNEAACQLYGYSEAEMLKLKNFELSAEPELTKKNTIEFNKWIEIRYHKKKDGTIFPVDISTSRFLLYGSYFVLVAIRDITKRKMAEQALEDSELKYRKLVENSPDAIVIYAQGKIVFVNREAIKQIRASSQDELIGKQAIQFVDPDYKNFVIERIKKMADGEVILPLVEEKFVRLDGSEVDVEVKAMSVNFDNMPAVQLIIRDITDRKQMEEELKRRNDALSKINKFSLELTMLSVDDNIEAFMTRRLKEITGAEVAIFSSYNYEDRTTTVKQIEIEPGLLKKVVGLLSSQINKIRCVVSEEMYREITQEIIGVRETLHEVSFGAISRPVGAAIQSLLHVDHFIGLAYLVEGKLYGTSVLAMKKGQPDLQREILENLALMIAGTIRRMKSEEQMNRQAQRISFHIENSPMAYMKWDADFILTQWSDTAEKIFGWSAKEVLGKPIMDLNIIYEEDIPYMESVINRLIKGTSRYVFSNNRNYTKNKKVIHCEWYNTVLTDQQGRMFSVMSQILDITERRQAEAKLLSEQAFRKSIESSLNSGIVTVDDDDRQTYVNPFFCKLFGWTKEELEGKSAPFVYWPADQLQYINEAFQLTISGKAPKEGFELEFVNKDGKRIPSQVIISPFYDGTKRIGWLSNIIDITQRKHVEEALRESQLRLSEAYKLAHMGIWGWETNTDTVTWSEELYRITGLDPMLPAPSYAEHATFCTPGSLKILSVLVERALKTGEPYQAELEFIRPDGDIRCVIVFGGVKQETNGQIKGLFGTVQDITERKLAEEKIRKVLEEKETLLHEVHHRVKNNLQAIIALIRMRTRSTKNAGTIKFLTELENQAYAMALVYEQLYQSEKLTQVGMTKYLRELTANVLDTHGRRDAVQFHLDAPLSLDVAQAMPCGLIVNELFSNILKYAFPPGFRGKPVVSISMHQDDETFHLMVSDNGVGFPPGYDLSKCQSMGLNLVNLWVTHQLGGTLTVSGKSGTTFTITFNLKD